MPKALEELPFERPQPPEEESPPGEAPAATGATVEGAAKPAES